MYLEESEQNEEQNDEDSRCLFQKELRKRKINRN